MTGISRSTSLAAAAEPPLDVLRAGPLPLAPDNFTPLSRTPWGGDAIGRLYKGALVSGSRGQKIGESWEFSCDPAAPSRVQGSLSSLDGLSLTDLINRWPAPILSPALAAQGSGCEVLVKILDAAEPLSLQVHPHDDDPNLAPGECGKPESWLILAARPGAGIYLGFAKPQTREQLRQALNHGSGLRDLLHFEPVKAGDYFDLQPGVPHAVGAGVTLLEPQRVLPGREGKTYRFWDWDRRYDASGGIDLKGGAARPLHIEAALPLVDPSRQVGPQFAASLRRSPQVQTLPQGGSVKTFTGNPYYQTALIDLSAGATVRLQLADGYAALVMLAGGLQAGARTLVAGQSALVPHAALPMNFTAQAAASTQFAIVAPATARWEWA